MSLENAESHFGLTELVISNRKTSSKSHLPVHIGSDKNNQGILLPESTPPEPAATCTPLELSPPPEVQVSQELPTMESIFKLACLLENSGLEELTDKLFLQLTLANNLTQGIF